MATIVSITVAPKTASIAAGNCQAFTATASDGYNTWSVTSQVVWSITAAAGGSWNQTSGTYTSAMAGTWKVTATLGALSDTAALTVNANAVTIGYIVISPKAATVSAGSSQSYTTTAFDKFGNSLGDVTSSTTFIAPDASVLGNEVTESTVGVYIVTATYNGLTDTASLTVTGYTAEFTENGLPTGTNWSVSFGGQSYSSTTDTIAVADLSALTYSWSTSGSIQNVQARYLTAETSGSLSIPNQLTQNVDYSTQYWVAYSTTGNALPVSTPANEWVNSGGQATGTFPAQVVNSAQNTQCNFISDNRPSSITQPTTIVGSYQTQYYLTVNSLYGTASGAGWYNSGSTATAAVSSGTISGSKGTQYVFSVWSGDASGSSINSNSIMMDNPKTATATWNTQYLVAYAVTGNALPITTPDSEWVNSGASATGTFVSSVADHADDTQCIFLSDNRTQDITQPTTITAAYQTQFKVTFVETGLQSDAKGTILIISGISEAYSNLATSKWVNSGIQITFSFEARVASTAANKVYSLAVVNSTSPVTIDKPTLIQASYNAIYSTSLYTVLLFVLILFVIIFTVTLLLGYRRRRQKIQQKLNEPGKPAV